MNNFVNALGQNYLSPRERATAGSSSSHYGVEGMRIMLCHVEVRVRTGERKASLFPPAAPANQPALCNCCHPCLPRKVR